MEQKYAIIKKSIYYWLLVGKETVRTDFDYSQLKNVVISSSENELEDFLKYDNKIIRSVKRTLSHNRTKQ